MTAQIMELIDATAYQSTPEIARGALVELVREFLVDQTAEPINAPGMDGPNGPVYVACYWTEQTTGLTPERIAALNKQLRGFAEIVPCDDAAAELAARGIVAKQQEGEL